MLAEFALIIVYLVPIISILLLFSSSRWRGIIASISIAFSSLYLATLSLRILVSSDKVVVVLVGSPSSTTYLPFVFDSISSLFLLGHGIIWFFVSLYSLYYVPGKKLNELYYWVYFNLLYLAMMSFFLTSNPIMSVLLLDLILILTALLIVTDRANVKARRAAIVYMVTSSIASMVILMGFLILSTEAGGVYDYLLMRKTFYKINQLDHYTIISSMLLLFGFSAKIGLVPLHFWLPRAHTEAPSTISAILSSLGVSLGVYGLVRVFFYVFKPFRFLSLFLIVLGIASIFYGSIYALACRDIKRLAAYSTIAHMGYVAFSLGSSIHLLEAGGILNLLGSITLASTLLYVFAHMLSKSLLFLSIGIVEAGVGLRDMNKLGGLSKAMKSTYRIIVLTALQLIGIPPSIIFIAKSLAHTATFSSVIQIFFESSIAIITTLLTASYMLKLLSKLSSPGKEYHKLLDLIKRKHSRIYEKYVILLLYGFIGLLMISPFSMQILYKIIDNLASTISNASVIGHVFITPVVAYTRLPLILQLISPEQELIIVVFTMLVVPLLTLIAYYIWSHLEYFSMYLRIIHDELVHEKIWLKATHMVKNLQYLLEDLEYDSKFMLILSLLSMIVLVLLLFAGG